MQASPRIPALTLLLAATLLAGGLSPAIHAQELARPGWAGFGTPIDPWWQQAVLYRLDPARFQDSDGNGRGDLAGVIQRLDYLQSLGIDAVLLDGPTDTLGSQINAPDPANSHDGSGSLDDLIRETSRRQMRVLLAVPAAMQAQPQPQTLATIRTWLNAGAAGIALFKTPSGTATENASYASLRSGLATLLRGFPGGRILLVDPDAGTADSTAPAAPTAQAGARRQHRSGPSAGPAVLTTATLLPVQTPDAAALRQALQALPAEPTAASHPLLRFAADPPTSAPDAGAAAVLLLASRGASLFDFGDEIGLDAYPDTHSVVSSANLPVMQWTPANVQQAPVERPAPPPPTGQNVYGPYRPYVRPPSRALTGPVPSAPAAVVDGNIPLPPPDPDTLPGFTSGVLPAPPVKASLVNVANEDRAPNSLLNAYRQLIALHHGNATLRHGALVVLNRDEQRAVVAVRRAPSGTRTASDVVLAVNLGDGPATLRLDTDLAHLGIRPGVLRALFSWAPNPLTGESTGALVLPPHAAFVGEIYRPRR